MTFLFDIGNVLLRFDYKAQLYSLIPDDCADAQERFRRLEAKRDDLESGRINAEEFINWALLTLESNATPEEFQQAWRSIFTPIMPTWQLAEKLANQGHRLILFSNINPIHCPWIYEAYSVFAHFHGAVMSYQIGCMKPNEKFYQHAISEYQLDPTETIYIDDLEANIDEGIRHGFHCHRYDDQDHQALEDFVNAFIK